MALVPLSGMQAGCSSHISRCGTYRLLSEVSSLLVAVHSLSAECGASSLPWLCTSLSAGLPRWSFLAHLPLSSFKHVWHRFLGCLSLLCGAFHALFLSVSNSSVVGSRSATPYMAAALLSPRRRASICSGPCSESSSGPSVLTFALMVTTIFCATLISS